ncbi:MULTISPECIES: hypothetical protein [unclassified Nostoc]|uniref:hypothetical protein n=1 Tax=unclassified Nostoc TaxID=2593658 RepID=UPI0025EB19E0|nr:hypothetical protein [Nostoc sp. JL23]
MSNRAYRFAITLSTGCEMPFWASQFDSLIQLVLTESYVLGFVAKLLAWVRMICSILG